MSSVVSEEEYSDDEWELRYTFFLVVILNKDTEILVHLPGRDNHRFSDLRSIIEDMKELGDTRLGNLNSLWRFRLNEEGAYVPLCNEFRRIGFKDYELLAHTDGTIRNPHIISINDSW